VDRLPSNLPIDGHSYRRVEILTGAPRRRRWSSAEKASIVAASFAPGAVTSTIALRHGLHRNQLYAWRRELRSAALANAGIPEFVPVVAEGRTASLTADRVKMLVYDGTGVVLIWKRLEGARFKWPAMSDGVMRLSGAQLAALFEGLDWRRVHAPRIARPKLAG
jgi:transposase